MFVAFSSYGKREAQGRGASARRKKGLQGVRHHVDPEESPFGPKDVVPPGGG